MAHVGPCRAAVSAKWRRAGFGRAAFNKRLIAGCGGVNGGGLEGRSEVGADIPNGHRTSKRTSDRGRFWGDRGERAEIPGGFGGFSFESVSGFLLTGCLCMRYDPAGTPGRRSHYLSSAAAGHYSLFAIFTFQVIGLGELSLAGLAIPSLGSLERGLALRRCLVLFDRSFLCCGCHKIYSLIP